MTAVRTVLLRSLLLWLLLELIAAAQVRRADETVLTSWVRAAVAPVASAAEWLTTAGSDLREGLRDTARLAAEVGHLRGELDDAETRIRLLEEDRAALREALDVAVAMPELDTPSVVARVTWRDLADGVMQVSAGRLDGVVRDTVVVAPGGVVGRVIRTAPHASWVELVTRATAAVAVRAADGGADALTVGAGNGTLRVDYLPRRSELLRGAELLTSGADGIYPPGLPVAQVTAVRESAGAFLEVTATPSAAIADTRVVRLLTGWPGRTERP